MFKFLDTIYPTGNEIIGNPAVAQEDSQKESFTQQQPANNSILSDITQQYDVLFGAKLKSASKIAIETGLAGKHLHFWVEKEVDDKAPGKESVGVSFYANARKKYFEGPFMSLQYSDPVRCCTPSNISFVSGKKFRDPDSPFYLSGYIGYQAPLQLSPNPLHSISGFIGIDMGIEF